VPLLITGQDGLGQEFLEPHIGGEPEPAWLPIPFAAQYARGYMELLKSDRKPDPWEKWLPRFLVELK
jgi:hypothetical protein